MFKRLGKLQHVEWSWSLALMVLGAIGSFSLPAWAVQMTGLFIEYSPLSWVVAGFAGLVTWAVSYALIAHARRIYIKTRYDAELIRKTGHIDPLAQSFEKKRIYLNDFVLPSNPYIEDKTFIECELIGPAILLMDQLNHIKDTVYPKMDAMLIPRDARGFNMIILRNCTFRKCRFIRITLAVREPEFDSFNNTEYVNWVTDHPGRQGTLPLPQSPTPKLAPTQDAPAVASSGDEQSEPSATEARDAKPTQANRQDQDAGARPPEG